MPRTDIRHSLLADMLRQLRRQTQSNIQARLRVGCSAGQRDVGDNLDRAEADTQGDLALALLQMEIEMVVRVDNALDRLAEGGYGRCLACDQEIAESRLRALPFAVRCRACEVTREQTPTQPASFLERPDGVLTEEISV